MVSSVLYGVPEYSSIMKRFRVAGLMTAVTVCLFEQAAYGASLTSWRFSPATNQLEITLSEATIPRYSLMSQPPRIVIYLPHTKLGRVETQQTYSGAVRLIRVALKDGDTTEIVLELSPQIVLTPEQVQLLLPPSSDGNRWVLRTLIAETATTLPTALPPPTFINPQTPMVKVPSLNRTEVSTPNPQTSANQVPVIFPANQQPTVTAPALSPATAHTNAMALATTSTIEFGEPLPKNRAALVVHQSRGDRGTDDNARNTPPLPSRERQGLGVASRTSAEVLLRAGSMLKLFYQGENNLNLPALTGRQQVLLLQEEIRDRLGNIIIPNGTLLIGRFETVNRGSRFITESLIIGKRNLPLVAHLNILSVERQMIALKHPNARQPKTIEAGQILQVQLAEDWHYARN